MRNRFRLDGSAFEIPNFNNAEVFVDRLVRRGLLVRDAAVSAALAGDDEALNARTAQRHFLRATGMSHATLRQIERARHATMLLRDGMSPGDVAIEAGYFDQAHLTRSLRRLIGLTPGSIAREERQLSFLYKTCESARRLASVPPIRRVTMQWRGKMWWTGFAMSAVVVLFLLHGRGHEAGGSPTGAGSGTADRISQVRRWRASWAPSF